MTVVVDTNVLLGMFRSGHPACALFDAWAEGKFRWAVTTEILLEYEEILGRITGPVRAAAALGAVETIGLAENNLLRIVPSFRFRLITADADDDKFADCAITAEADYVITEDGHFDALADAGFKVRAITLAEFIRRHLDGE